MAWKVFEARKLSPSTMAAVAIQARGTLSLNRKAHELLVSDADGKGDLHVELMYDDSRKAVGMRVAEPSKNTYRLRKQPRSESYLVSAKAFLRECQIELKAQRYTAHMEDDILVFLLDKKEADSTAPKKPGRKKGK